MKPAQHEDAGIVDLVHALGDVAACVLFLACRDQNVRVRASMPIKTEKYPACCIIFNKASSSARLREASVDISNG